MVLIGEGTVWLLLLVGVRVFLDVKKEAWGVVFSGVSYLERMDRWESARTNESATVGALAFG